jgi:tetratricopeptide (TPR) repeat protein
MENELVNKAFTLMKSQSYQDALSVLHSVIDHSPSNINAWYLAGQCYRYLNDFDNAVKHLATAAELKKDDPSIHLALGIAYQLQKNWQSAINAFKKAIELDPDQELAYNSLALTQKKAGDLEKAIHNYDAGAKALSRRIVKEMTNNRRKPILKHRDTSGQLWIEYAMNAAIQVASLEGGITEIAFPNGETAIEEERTEKHEGLYWEDVPNDKGGVTRYFLPNFFNTFIESLKIDPAYSNLIGNRGTALKELGLEDEAHAHFNEAEEFMP